jgi:hypothetical protein
MKEEDIVSKVIHTFQPMQDKVAYVLFKKCTNRQKVTFDSPDFSSYKIAQEQQGRNNTISFFPRTETSSIILILSYVRVCILKDYSARSQGAKFFNRQISS